MAQSNGASKPASTPSQGPKTSVEAKNQTKTETQKKLKKLDNDVKYAQSAVGGRKEHLKRREENTSHQRKFFTEKLKNASSEEEKARYRTILKKVDSNASTLKKTSDDVRRKQMLTDKLAREAEKIQQSDATEAQKEEQLSKVYKQMEATTATTQTTGSDVTAVIRAKNKQIDSDTAAGISDQVEKKVDGDTDRSGDTQDSQEFRVTYAAPDAAERLDKLGASSLADEYEIYRKRYGISPEPVVLKDAEGIDTDLTVSFEQTGDVLAKDAAGNVVNLTDEQKENLRTQVSTMTESADKRKSEAYKTWTSFVESYPQLREFGDDSMVADTQAIIEQLGNPFLSEAKVKELEEKLQSRIEKEKERGEKLKAYEESDTHRWSFSDGSFVEQGGDVPQSMIEDMTKANGLELDGDVLKVNPKDGRSFVMTDGSDYNVIGNLSKTISLKDGASVDIREGNFGINGYAYNRMIKITYPDGTKNFVRYLV